MRNSSIWLKLLLLIILLAGIVFFVFLVQRSFSSSSGNETFSGILEELNQSSITISDSEGELQTFELGENTVFATNEGFDIRLTDKEEIEGFTEDLDLSVSVGSFYRGIAGFVFISRSVPVTGGIITFIEEDSFVLNDGEIVIFIDNDTVITTYDALENIIEVDKSNLSIGDFIVAEEEKVENEVSIATKIHASLATDNEAN